MVKLMCMPIALGNYHSFNATMLTLTNLILAIGLGMLGSYLAALLGVNFTSLHLRIMKGAHRHFSPRKLSRVLTLQASGALAR